MLLTFDTCLDKTYVVLRTESDIISSETIFSDEKSYHSAYLISTIKNILKVSNKTPQDLYAIAIAMDKNKLSYGKSTIGQHFALWFTVLGLLSS